MCMSMYFIILFYDLFFSHSVLALIICVNMCACEVFFYNKLTCILAIFVLHNFCTVARCIIHFIKNEELPQYFSFPIRNAIIRLHTSGFVDNGKVLHNKAYTDKSTVMEFGCDDKACIIMS